MTDAAAIGARWRHGLAEARAACLERQRQDVRAVVDLARRFGSPEPEIKRMADASLERLDRDEERRAWQSTVDAEVYGLPPDQARALVAPVAFAAAFTSWYLSDQEINDIIASTR